MDELKINHHDIKNEKMKVTLENWRLIGTFTVL